MEVIQSHPELEALGFRNLNQVYWQLHTPQLYEQAVRRQEGFIAHLGPLVVRTGHHTGRSPQDRFIVRDPSHDEDIWWGDINKPYDEKQFDSILQKMLSFFEGKNAYVQNCFICNDKSYRKPVRIITEKAWHSLFARNMFVRATDEELPSFNPAFTLIHAPSFHAVPEVDGTNSSAFILIDFKKGLVLIGGTNYAGEVKKAIFTVVNYLLPKEGVLTMHCSANEGDNRDTAVFFGLSGTGKTTLSTNSSRTLIGDDEHGWTDSGIFNLEGGCYAKVINLSPTSEPEIYHTTRRFGTILENVGVDMSDRRIDLNDGTLTLNTRASYPITHISNATRSGRGGHPRNILFLATDMFGILPPVSMLTTEQAMYHFLSGYTAKIADTEIGIDEPEATFSAGFGEPFLPLNPLVYARMLGEKIRRYNSRVFLLNTGWIGGPYGVGRRIELRTTRAIVDAILEGTMCDLPTTPEPFFGLAIPQRCPKVPYDILNPRDMWADKDAYDRMASDLVARFKANFDSKYGSEVPDEIQKAGPPG